MRDPREMIIVHKPILRGKKIISKIEIPGSLRQFLESYEFYAVYSEEIRANESILIIPVLASILPLAWLTETDIMVDKIDETYLGSIYILQDKLKRIYPKVPFGVRIHAEELVSNRIKKEETAIPFSGGLDSLYTLANNWMLDPYVVFIHGLTHRTWNIRYSEKAEKLYSKWTEDQLFRFCTIKTNIRELLAQRRINKAFKTVLGIDDFYGPLQLPILLSGIIAPLSIGRFDRLLMSATTSEETRISSYNLSQIPDIDETIRWADLRIKHYGYIPREDKIPIVTRYVDKTKLGIINSCIAPDNFISGKQTPFGLCCGCEKCMWTIVELLVHNKDPRRYGFEVDKGTFDYIRNRFENEKLYPYYVQCYWKPLQKMVLRRIKDFNGSRKFLEWFKEYPI